jgi:hypothetical protein
LFPRRIREDWEKALLKQPRRFVPSEAPKFWFDPNPQPDASGTIEYDVFDRTVVDDSSDDPEAFRAGLQKLRLTPDEARSLNVTGRYVYPDDVIQPTSAVVEDMNGGEQPISPEFLSHRAEAEILRAEMDARTVVENTLERFTVHWRGETRRWWLIRRRARSWNAGLLLRIRYRDGVGAPGVWTNLDSTRPKWITTPQIIENDTREVLVPIRQLASDERIQLSPWGDTVYRVDSTGGDGTGFPPAIRAQLDRIESDIQAIYQAVHLTR